ncbi:MAG TPA: PAS domain S-box protein [Acetobacteraceae bacterium]|nr:PAS domain S-box protein [Acetobacteraceae bacterium]
MTTPTMSDTPAPDQLAELRTRLTEAEEALHAIRSGEVDAITVSTPSGELIYALRGADQPYREMIEAMSEGALNISPEGVVLYCNQFFAQLAKADLQTIIGAKLEVLFVERDRARISKALQEGLADTSRVGAHLLATDGTQVPVNVAMRLLGDGNVRSIVVVTSDLTQMVLAQETTTKINLKLEEANRALHMLNQCNATIMHATDEKQMLAEICQLLVDSGGYQLAWFGYGEPDEARPPRPIAWADGRPESIQPNYVPWDDPECGQGPIGLTIRTGQIAIARDTEANAAMWRDMIHRADGRSAMSLPLRTGGQVFGGLVVYSSRPDAFDEQESNILLELVNDVAYCITNLRREKNLAETRALLDNILQSSTKYSIIGVTIDGTIVFWNEGARRNYGYTANEIIGQSWNVLYAPEDRASDAANRLVESAKSHGIAEGEFERLRKDGTRFPASVALTRRDDASGKPIGYLVISSDITEKHRSDEQMRDAAQYTRSLIEASLDPLLTISTDGKITDINHATELITGQIRERLIGSDFALYFTEPEKARAGYQRVFTKGFVIDYPLAIRHMSGTVTEVLFNASLYRLANGEVGGVFAAARDISRMQPADLLPTKRRRFGWRHAGIAVAAVAFVVGAVVLPTMVHDWLQSREQLSELYRLTATNARMHALLDEVKPTPARVRAAKIQPGDLGPVYTVIYATTAPDHQPGIIGKEQLLSRFGPEIAALSTGNCAHLTHRLLDQTVEVSDFIVCPIAEKTRLVGLLTMGWDRGDAVPTDFAAATAAAKQAGSDIAAIWARK